MRFQKLICYITFVVCIVSGALFVSFKTWLEIYDLKEIFSNFSISIFGSSLLVFIPALISFINKRNIAKKKIIVQLSKIENLINDIQFQTTFLKDDDEYKLDFSFEKININEVVDFKVYNTKRELYLINANRVEKIYKTLVEIDNFDFSFLDEYINDYVHLFNNENKISMLYDCYYDIVKDFRLRNYEVPYGYGARQYDCGNATIGQFFDIWLKKFLITLEPIYDKLETLRTIFLIYNLMFYKKAYIETVNSSDAQKKKQLKILIEKFYKNYNLKPFKKINKLLKILNQQN